MCCSVAAPCGQRWKMSYMDLSEGDDIPLAMIVFGSCVSVRECSFLAGCEF